MACFTVPMAEAIVITIVKKIMDTKEKKALVKKPSHEKFPLASLTGLTWSRKFSWLKNLLWGGTLLLAFEHLWHGEIVPWPPFLTAMSNPADIGPMLHEIATVGTAMAAFVTIIWGLMVLIADRKSKTNSIKINAEIKTEV